MSDPVDLLRSEPRETTALASASIASVDDRIVSAAVAAPSAADDFVREPYTSAVEAPRRRRNVLPQCKGFQIYRPNTACRMDAPR